MSRHALEIADIFRAHGTAWRQAEAGHLSLGQFKVMAAIERCRTAALGGHVAACEACTPEHIAHNSCRNRPPTTIMAPKCQGAAAREWLAARQAERLPASYFHVVFTLPAPIAGIADDTQPPALAQPCPCCGSRMIIGETFERGGGPRSMQPIGLLPGVEQA